MNLSQSDNSVTDGRMDKSSYSVSTVLQLEQIHINSRRHLNFLYAYPKRQIDVLQHCGGILGGGGGVKILNTYSLLDSAFFRNLI